MANNGPSDVDTHNNYTWAGARCPYYIVPIIIIIFYTSKSLFYSHSETRDQVGDADITSPTERDHSQSGLAPLTQPSTQRKSRYTPKQPKIPPPQRTKPPRRPWKTNPSTTSCRQPTRASVLTAHLRQDEAQRLLPGQWIAEDHRGRRWAQAPSLYGEAHGNRS